MKSLLESLKESSNADKALNALANPGELFPECVTSVKEEK